LAIENRGPDFEGSFRGGRDALFRATGNGAQWKQFTLTEAPIAALSLDSLEGVRPDAAYAATSG
jgi:hypothetical protein